MRSGDLSRRLLGSKLLQAAFLGVLVIASLGAGESRFDRLGHEMICMCGCNQILNECNHVGCPVSPVMLNELHQQIGSGASDTSILNWFAAKYGAVVLAAPIRGGFDDVAWAVPIAVFVFATAGTAAVVWAWRRRSLRLADAARGFGCGGVLDYDPRDRAVPSADPAEQALRDRIRQETEYR